jgi:diguanylate cyclase (GGDEF)-like protein/PAS domain S-box-containing protein
MSETEARLLEEIEALRRVVSARDHALLSLTRRMDQVIETMQADRDRLDQTVKRERELSRFVQQVLANMHDMLIIADPEGQIVQANTAAHRELGFEPERLLGVAVDSLLPSEIRVAYQKALPKQPVVSASIWVETIAQRGSYLAEHGLLGLESQVAGFFRVGAEFLYSPQGKFAGVVFTASNFTQRKEAEQALVDSETRLRRMLDGSPVPLFVIDQQHRLTHWNRACEALTGISAAEMMGARDYWRTFYDTPRPCLLDLVLDNVDAAEFARYYPSGIQTRQLAERILEGEGFFPKLGNKWLFFTAAPIRDSQGRMVAAMESIQDITERKQHEQALRLAANVFEHAREGIIITDVEGTIIDVNRAFEDITGYSREEAIHCNPRFLQSGHHDAAFYVEMWRIITECGYWHGELWNRRKSGEVYPQSASISAVHNANGQVTYYVGLFADISVLKESQQRLERMAYYDPLTGLPNRVLLADRLRLMLAKAQREHRVLAVCYLDLDGFKPVNDCWGHTAGDELLVQVAQRFQQSVRGDDTVARLGGDEFVILLSSLSSVEEGETILERIFETLSAPFSLKAAAVTISASIGVTFFPIDSADPDTLIRHADQAMYRAKQGGRSRYHLFDPERDGRMQIPRASGLVGNSNLGDDSADGTFPLP